MRNKKLIAIFCVMCGLTFLLILNSVVFSVQYIYAYGINTDDSIIQEAVLASHKLKKGRSIFLANKKTAAENVEKGVAEITGTANVRVVNIEKKFPNRVYINYAVVGEYLKIKSGGKVYYVSNTGLILRAEDIASDPLVSSIEVFLNGGAVERNAGESFLSVNDYDNIAIKTLLPALERIGTREEVTARFEFIDLRKPYVYLKTVTGLYFELQTLDKTLEKLHLGVSLYEKLLAEDIPKTRTGTIILSGGSQLPGGPEIIDSKAKVRASYNENNRYANGIT